MIRTTILESNRLQAINKEQENNIYSSSSKSLLNQTDQNELFPNYRWKTHIDNGLQLNVGDSISLEACSVQQRGAGEEAIEFLGEMPQKYINFDTNNKTPIRDNAIKMEFNYYMSNNKQFNMNLPMTPRIFPRKTNYRISDNIGGPAFQANIFIGSPVIEEPSIQTGSPSGIISEVDDFQAFKSCYPYEAIQGNNTISTADPPVWNQAHTISLFAPHSKGNKNTYAINSTRFYVCDKNHTGPYFRHDFDGELNEPFDFVKTTCILNLDKGFVFPNTISEDLSSQLRFKLGGENFKTINEYKPYYYSQRLDIETFSPVISKFRLLQKPIQPYTTSTNISLPTSTGKVMDAFYNDEWDIDPSYFIFENPIVGRVNSYKYQQAMKIYYKYMMTAQPDYYKCCCEFNIHAQSLPLNGASVFTPETRLTMKGGIDTGRTDLFNYTSYGGEVGCVGNNVVCFDYIDIIGGKTIANFKVNDHTHDPNTDTWVHNGVITETSNVFCMKTEQNQVLITNMIWNPANLNKIRDMFDISEYPDDDIGDGTNPDSDDFRNNTVVDLDIGRLDDTYTYQTQQYGDTVGYWNRNIMLHCPLVALDVEQNPPSLGIPNSYKTGNYVNWLMPNGNEIIDDAYDPITQPASFVPTNQYLRYQQATMRTLIGNTKADTPYRLKFFSCQNKNATSFNQFNMTADFPYKSFYDSNPTHLRSRFISHQKINTPSSGPYGDTQEHMDILYNEIPTLRNGNKLACMPLFLREPSQGEWVSGDLVNSKLPYIALIIKSKKEDVDYPAPTIGEYFGWSPSESTCELSQIVSTQKPNYSVRPQAPNFEPVLEYPIINTQLITNDNPPVYHYNRADLSQPACYSSFVSLGTIDPLIEFNNSFNKFSIKNFHTQLTKGSGAYQFSPVLGQPVSVDPEQKIAEYGSNNSYTSSFLLNISKYLSDEIEVEFLFFDARSFSYGEIPRLDSIISSQGGVSINKLYLIENTNKFIDKENTFEISPYKNFIYYTDCIFDKLGFSLEQLLPVYGLPSGVFNKISYNKYLGFGPYINVNEKWKNMVKPFTTNGLLDATITNAFGTRQYGIDSSGTVLQGVISNMFNLGSVQIEENSIISNDSDSLIAINLPSKLAYPYLVVCSDICNTSYFGGPDSNTKLSAIGYITRNYSQGDYYYSFSTNWNYIVDKKRVLTSFRTSIHLPNGLPAPIGRDNTIFYKINQSQTMPEEPNKK